MPTRAASHPFMSLADRTAGYAVLQVPRTTSVGRRIGVPFGSLVENFIRFDTYADLEPTAD